MDFAVSVSLWTPLTHPHRHLPRQCCDISLWQHSSRFSDERHFRGSLYVDYLLVLRPSLWALTAFTIPKKKTPSNTRRRFFVNTDLVVLPSAFRSIVSGERLIHVMDVGRLMLLPYLSDTTLLTYPRRSRHKATIVPKAPRPKSCSYQDPWFQSFWIPMRGSWGTRITKLSPKLPELLPHTSFEQEHTIIRNPLVSLHTNIPIIHTQKGSSVNLARTTIEISRELILFTASNVLGPADLYM